MVPLWLILRIMGDFSGLGGNAALNTENHAGYSDDVLMTFNIGGALGDSTWLNAGEMPIVSMQGEADFLLLLHMEW